MGVGWLAFWKERPLARAKMDLEILASHDWKRDRIFRVLA
jgi:hypothetical protein